MIKKRYPWILIDKANMSKTQHRFSSVESVAFAMMKSGTLVYRDFSEFIVIKDEMKVVDLSALTRGCDAVSFHAKVKKLLELF
jgi:hypothetical protein